MKANLLEPLFSFLTALIVAAYAIPVIIKVAFIKKLYDKPGGRKTHLGYIPNLGGIAIFTAFLLAFVCWANFSVTSQFQYLILGLILLHITGVKDDIIPLDPIKKLGAQVMSAIILVVPGQFRITDMYGILGIHHLPALASVLLSIFTVIVIVNAFNLIDGIDGLAGGIALIISLAFSYVFWTQRLSNMLTASLALCGALVSFLFYNKAPARIFMGDAGSMCLGYLMAAFAFQFVHVNAILPQGNFHHNPAGVVAFLIIPLFDTLRVFTLRILHGRSPFSADCNHIHHRLLSLGLSHGRTSMVLYAVNIGFIGLAYALKGLNPDLFLLIISGLACMLVSVPSFLVYLRKRKIKYQLSPTLRVSPTFEANIKPEKAPASRQALASEVHLN